MLVSSISLGVSWGELTSSQLRAPSYDEAGKQAPDYRQPTTDYYQTIIRPTGTFFPKKA